MHDMMTLNDGDNYLGESVSFMVDFDFYRLAVALIPNNLIHYSNYNVDLLTKRLKDTFKLKISRFTKSVSSHTTNSSTAVAHFFSLRAI